MTAILAVVALEGAATISPEGFAAGVRSLGGFAPFGADEVDVASLRLWVARSFRGTGLAAADGRVLAIDGRLRDRAEFVKRHALASDASDASDAALILAAYAERGPALFESLDADIALLLVDAPARRVILFRDVLGERGLRYAVRGTQLQASSRGSAIVAMRGETLVPNEVAMAHYFALRAPPDEVAWMQGVEELPAGGLLLIEDGHRRYRRFTPDLPTSPLRFGSDAEAAEAWRDVVAGAVGRACADASRPTVMLSGGIDSTLIAAFLDPSRAGAVSWTLPGMPECDEIEFAKATAAMLGLPHDIVDGDLYPPLADIETWPMEDEAPLANSFRKLTLEVFRMARVRGADVIVSGNYGDHLYADARGWPMSLVRERGVRALIVAIAEQVNAKGLGEVLRNRGLRQSLRPRRSPQVRDWLTRDARGLLEPAAPRTDEAYRWDKAYARASAQGGDLSRRYTNASGVEMRFPYRDPLVLSRGVAFPAHYSGSLRPAKWLSREVLGGMVPEKVRLRPKACDLTPFFRRGLIERAGAVVHQILMDPDATWPRFLSREALISDLRSPDSQQSLLRIWLAVGSELWLRAHRRQGPAVLASSRVRF